MSTRSKEKAHQPLSEAQINAVARLFSILSEPSRLVLLQVLQRGPRSVTELVEAAGMKQANVSKHLAVLHDHRLVERERDGSRVLYRIADPMIFSLCALVCDKAQRDARETAAMFDGK